MVRVLLLAALAATGPVWAEPVPALAAPPVVLTAEVPASGVPAPAGQVTHPGGTSGRVATSSWGWPLAPDPTVVERFQAPPTPWGVGHRGVDLAATVGQPVLSDGPGRVTFSGRVAGRGVVVLAHADGLRSSYEPVDERAPVGTLVSTGSPIGVVSTDPGHCRPATCLHWGVRRDGAYVDPLLLLGQGPPVLLPLNPQ